MPDIIPTKRLLIGLFFAVSVASAVALYGSQANDSQNQTLQDSALLLNSNQLKVEPHDSSSISPSIFPLKDKKSFTFFDGYVEPQTVLVANSLASYEPTDSLRWLTFSPIVNGNDYNQLVLSYKCLATETSQCPEIIVEYSPDGMSNWTNISRIEKYSNQTLTQSILDLSTYTFNSNLKGYYRLVLDNGVCAEASKCNEYSDFNSRYRFIATGLLEQNPELSDFQ